LTDLAATRHVYEEISGGSFRAYEKAPYALFLDNVGNRVGLRSRA
jgi:hypothetical protein